MMSLISITINDPGFDSKAAEVAFLQRTLDIVVTEFARARGNKASGTILGPPPKSDCGNPTSLGSWTYSPSATKP